MALDNELASNSSVIHLTNGDLSPVHLMPAHPSLTGIPRELRFEIYMYLFDEVTVLEGHKMGDYNETAYYDIDHGDHGDAFYSPYRIQEVCRLIRDEAEEIAYYTLELNERDTTQSAPLRFAGIPPRVQRQISRLVVGGDIRVTGQLIEQIFATNIFPNLQKLHWSMDSKWKELEEEGLSREIRVMLIANEPWPARRFVTITARGDAGRLIGMLDSDNHDFDYNACVFQSQAEALLSKDMARLGWLGPNDELKISSLEGSLVTRPHTITVDFEVWAELLSANARLRYFEPVFMAVSLCHPCNSCQPPS